MQLEHFQKYCSHAGREEGEAVFLGFGFVSAQSQGHPGHAPSPKPRQNPKILAPRGYSISSNALARPDHLRNEKYVEMRDPFLVPRGFQ